MLQGLRCVFFFMGRNAHKKGPNNNSRHCLGPKYFFSWLTNFIIDFLFHSTMAPFSEGGGDYFKYKRDHQKQAVTMPNDDNRRLVLMFFLFEILSKVINKINCMK